MISAVFVRKPNLAIVISIVTVLSGLLCMMKLPIAEYPEIAPPSVMVHAQYSGASAQVVADTIASPIEAECNGLEDMIYFNSTSDNTGTYSLNITFASGTNTDIAQVNVQNAVNRAEPLLPSEVKLQGVTVKKRSSDVVGMFVFLGDPKKISEIELNNFVRVKIRDVMSRIDGISEAQIFGERSYSMRIWLDPLRMTSLKVGPAQIIAAINEQNIQAAAGTVGAENSNKYIQLKVNALGRLKTVKQFENIVVKSKNKKIVKLRDVARVELGSESYAAVASYNGKSSAAVGLYRNSDANAIQVIDRAKAKLEEMKANGVFPDGVEYLLGYDPTEYIRISMEEIFWTLLITLVLVVAITYLFLQDWRATLIPAITIPVSLTGTFIFLLPFGLSINVLTMFGLILVIGSVVDDAIVVTENTMRIIEEDGLPAKEATIKSMDQITSAVIATTLVILAIYAPVSFYGGMVGTIYLQFSVAMCIALCLSTVNALTLSPALCSLLLRKKVPPKHNFFAPFNFVLDKLRNAYLSFTGLLVRRTLLTVILFAGVLFANWALYDRTPTSFIPPEDKGALLCELELPPGATLARTDAVVHEFIDRCKKIPGIKDTITVAGFGFLGGNSENVGMAVITLKSWSERKTPDLQIGAIQARVQKEAAEIYQAKINVFAPPAIMGLGATGGVSFQLCTPGDEAPEKLQSVLNNFIYQLNMMPETLYAFTTYNANTPQIYLDIDRVKAEALEIPISRIFSTLQSKLASYYVNDFNLSGLSFKVKIQSEAKERSSISSIQHINVLSNNGKMVPLSTFATPRYIIGPRQIIRFNQSMSASVQAQAKQGYSSGYLMDKIQNLARKTLPRGYTVEWTDMSYQEKHNQGKILTLMLLALTFGYLFLVAQYESWTIPSSVMLTVAFATLGGLIGLLMYGLPMSIYAQLGFVMLIGLSAKNSILIVEFSMQNRAEGASINDAAMNGANSRFRAVMMTAWSFVIGVFPMVIATGAGAGSRIAIGVTTFYGMILSSIIGICFVPPIYAIFQRMREGTMRFVKGK